jgi:hypothetical protein
MGAWEEMEAYESGFESNGAAISTVCFLGQYFFGLVASVIFGFAGHLISRHTDSDGLDDHVNHLCMIDFLIAFGAAFGVFASSSGGGNPCLYTSGGGKFGFLAIFLASMFGMLVSKFVFNGGVGGSLVPEASLATACATITAGFAAASAMSVFAFLNSDAQKGDLQKDDVENNRLGLLKGTLKQSDVKIAIKIASNERESVSQNDRVIFVIANSIRDEMLNPEIIVRLGSIFAISIGLHVYYSISFAIE